VWYAGSFAIGALAGLVGDRVNLGFVVETERQVEEHLTTHLDRLPSATRRAAPSSTRCAPTRRATAPWPTKRAARIAAPVPTLMRAAANVMKALAYRV
jgi:ubiquinone biosynthesis monooxygenase Coq7